MTSFSRSRQAYCGVSLGSHLFSRLFFQHLSAFAAKEHISNVTVVLADFPHAFTYMAIRHVGFETALFQISKIATEKFKFLSRMAKSYPLLTVARWTDYSVSPDYVSIRDSFLDSYNVDPDMRRDIDALFCAHCLRHSPETDLSSIDIRVGATYLIEEYSMMIYLYSFCGFDVQIAPTSLSDVFRNIYKGRYSSSGSSLLTIFSTPKVHVHIASDGLCWKACYEYLG